MRQPDYAIENGTRASSGRLLRGKETCPYCDDDGLIAVAFSKDGTPQAAPCPRCRLGYQTEFALGVYEKRAGIWEERRGVMPYPWQPHGFWDGKDVDEYGQAIIPGYVLETRSAPVSAMPLTLAENRKRLRLLMTRLRQLEAGMEPGLAADPAAGLESSGPIRQQALDREIVRVESMSADSGRA